VIKNWACSIANQFFMTNAGVGGFATGDDSVLSNRSSIE
jgi:hypothetical protein